MEELTRIQASRRAHKAHVTRLLKKTSEILTNEKPDEMLLSSLNTSLEQLVRKRDLIRELDQKIEAKTTDEKNLETEIFEAEELSCDLEEKINHIRKYIDLSISALNNPSTVSTQENTGSSLPSVSQNTNTEPSSAAADVQSHDQSTPDHQPLQTNPLNTSISLEDTPTTQLPSSNTVPNMSQTICKLPKLNPPVFCGNPLDWQSFWDSFEAAVHRNPSLNGIQKFNYLKAQLKNEALHAIMGFQLTNSNYEQAVTLLKDRFGQTHKVINAHMQALLDIRSPNGQLEDLQKFYNTLETHIRGLASLGKAHESYGDLLIPIILGKLPNDVRKNLAREHETLDWTIDQLRNALQKELRILEAGKFVNPTLIESKDTKSSITSSFYTGIPKDPSSSHYPSSRAKGPPPCVYCKKAHSSKHCQTVTDYQKRLEIIKKENLCFNCLGHHKASKCQSKNRCTNCNRKHHTSLCNKENEPSTPKEQTTHNEDTQQKTPEITHATLTPTTQMSYMGPSPHQTSLLKTAIATIRSDSTAIETNILFDEGAQRSFMSQSLASKLGLQSSTKETINLATFGAVTPTRRNLDVVTIHIETESSGNIPIQALIVPEIATPLQNSVRTATQNYPYLLGLKLAVTDNENFEISLLIGADHYWDIVEDHIIRGNGPTAMQSKLGYLLSGPIASTSNTRNYPTNILNVMLSHREEDDRIERFWNLETLGITEPDPHIEENSFIHEYQQTSISRERDGSYTARFPWKKDHPPLPTNNIVCEKRTRATIKRLNQTPDLLHTYGTIIKEQEQRGFIKKIPNTANNHNVHYVPHHPVKKDSPTTPIRIVYDCSCKASPKLASLNDCPQPGPPLLNDMSAILLRFRTHSYGIVTDIEKAFLHLNLHEDDRDFTRFLWLSDPADPNSSFDTYRFKAVPFGTTSSPFMLNATVQHHLENFNSPVSLDMKRNMYVDNVISGTDTETSAINYYNEARFIMNDAKFNLRSWASNCSDLQDLAIQENTADTGDEINVLGMHWKNSSDTLTLTNKATLNTRQQLITKREVLQQSSKIFDPLGMITPITIRAKIFMQQLWQESIDWDEPLNETLTENWQKIVDDLQAALMTTTIPRRYHLNSNSKTVAQLHCFVDSSIKAYGAVTYLKHGHEISFVMAKTRVAPIKKLTLPQLELMAALIGTRLLSFIHNAMNSRYDTLEVYLWSDSQIVLYWINSNKQLKQFVTNRVNSIKELFPPSTWHYCPTHENPADILTRGFTTQQMQSSSLWQNGPAWLTLSQEYCPPWSTAATFLTQAIQAPETVEMSPSPIHPTINICNEYGIHCIVDIAQSNCLDRLIRVTSYVLRFIGQLRKQTSFKEAQLTVEETTTAETLWIQSCQQSAILSTYQSELDNLISKNKPRITLVKQLRLFLDDQCLIRCRGRIHNAPVSESTKFPILLPTNHPFTKLVVLSIHHQQLHSGVNSTLTAVRQRFWIPRARQLIRKILRKCVICRKQGGKPYTIPDPPPLPKWRLEDSPPFTVTGVDFTGALYVKTSSIENKVYVCLFTCANTRAIHLEVVEDLSKGTFLKAFRRFVSRRSLPRKMVSDNATTYLSAAEELKRLLDSVSLKETLSHHGCDWIFIPKRAPWYGGFWERLIGLTKNALKKVLGRAQVTLSELQTIIVEIEAILNDRPLTYVSADIDDEEALTPSHLLNGRRITSLPHEKVDDEDIHDPDYGNLTEVTKRARRQALLLQHFRNRWRTEYLTSLREFHRTTGNNKQIINIGDVVLVHDDKPRINWKLAVIENFIEGEDGQIRAAHIRTATGKTNRPIAKLYPLEVRATTRADNPVETKESIIHNENSPEDRMKRPIRAAAKNALRQISNWAKVLNAPPEDVVN